MRELPTAIPDVDVLLDLEPEELAAKMLFLVRARRDDMFTPEISKANFGRGAMQATRSIHWGDSLMSAWQFARLGLGLRPKG